MEIVIPRRQRSLTSTSYPRRIILAPFISPIYMAVYLNFLRVLWKTISREASALSISFYLASCIISLVRW